jgi:hypothetical protein
MALQATAPQAEISIDASTGMYAPQLSGGETADLLAGEALLAGAPCYVKASDGKVYMTNGTAANEAAKCDGFTAKARAINQAVTLFGPGARFHYATGMTPGQNFYAATTSGRLDTAPTTGGTVILARAVSSTDIVVFSKA